MLDRFIHWILLENWINKLLSKFVLCEIFYSCGRKLISDPCMMKTPLSLKKCYPLGWNFSVFTITRVIDSISLYLNKWKLASVTMVNLFCDYRKGPLQYGIQIWWWRKPTQYRTTMSTRTAQSDGLRCGWQTPYTCVTVTKWPWPPRAATSDSMTVPPLSGLKSTTCLVRVISLLSHPQDPMSHLFWTLLCINVDYLYLICAYCIHFAILPSRIYYIMGWICSWLYFCG